MAEIYVKSGDSFVKIDYAALNHKHKVADISDMSNYRLNSIFPVGCVYISYTSTSPATLFGGSWTAITGRFPYFNAGTNTGGSNSTIVDFNHTHRQTANFTSSKFTTSNGYRYVQGETVSIANVATGDSAWSGGENPDIGLKKILGTKTINTMPAYQSVYAWRRTA